MRFLSKYSAPTILVIGFAAVLGIALIVAASTSTTAFGAYNSAWDGTAELRSIADSTGADSQPITNTSAYPDHPASSTVALILAPDQPYHDQETTQIDRFVRQGGTIVIADERPTQTNAFLADLGAEARIDGEPLRDSRHYYQSSAAPVVRNVSTHPFTTNVSALTLNHGSAVTPHSATVLARTSGYAYRDSNGNGEPDQAEVLTDYPVVTIDQVGEGQIIVVGDPSLFINTMLEQSDNRQFVQNLFGAHDTVLLDYSHTSSIPPLMQAVLFVQRTPLALFLSGVFAVLIIAVLRSGSNRVATLGQSHTIHQRWSQLSPTSEQTDTTASPIADADLIRYLRTRYPEWEDERLRRIVTARRQHSDSTTHTVEPTTDRSQ